MITGINDINGNVNLSAELLLNGSDVFSKETNMEIFSYVYKYIEKTKRFNTVS